MESFLFKQMQQYDYENLFFCQEQRTGLKAVIAIHSTALGPAAGGTRMWTYATEQEAIIDAMRLARGMTYKLAAIGAPFGGGKCVLIGDPAATSRRRCCAPWLALCIDWVGSSSPGLMWE